MKNSSKGFIVPLLLVVIAILVIGFGVYIHENKKSEVPGVVDTGTQQTNTQIPPASVNTPSVKSLAVLSPQKNDVFSANDKIKIEWTAGSIVKRIQLLYGTSFFKDFTNIEPGKNFYSIDLKTIGKTSPRGYGYSVKLFSDTVTVESGNFTITPSSESVVANSRDDQRKRDVGQLRLAFEMYYDSNGFYPNSLSQLLPQIIPKLPVDPLDKTSYDYSIISNKAGYILRVNFEQKITPFYNAKACAEKVGRYCLEFKN